MTRRDIIVMGASAGGMDALQKVVAGLPAGLEAAVFVVWHMGPGLRSVLPEVLTKAGKLNAANPQDGDRIEPGRIYVAPNDHHLLLESGYMRVTKGPKENRFRPAVDPLFRSAAYVYGSRVIGVVLSGSLDDGTSGLWTIKMRGGTAVVQDPEDAMHRSMPLHALENVQVDHRLPAGKIGELLGRLAAQPASPSRDLPQREHRLLEHELRIAAAHEALAEHVMDYGELSPFTCPECHGVLTMLREGKAVRFRCHTGHALSADSLLASNTEEIEKRLWDGVRALDECVMLLNTLGQQFLKTGDTKAAEQCFDKAREAHARAAPVREAANASDQMSTDDVRSGVRAQKQASG